MVALIKNPFVIETPAVLITNNTIGIQYTIGITFKLTDNVKYVIIENIAIKTVKRPVLVVKLIPFLFTANIDKNEKIAEVKITIEVT